MGLNTRGEFVSWCFEPSQPQRITLGLNTRGELVSWCFEPSQPQRITLGLNTRGELVSWCFEPSQPQRITLGLNTRGETECFLIIHNKTKCAFKTRQNAHFVLFCLIKKVFCLTFCVFLIFFSEHQQSTQFQIFFSLSREGENYII